MLWTKLKGRYQRSASLMFARRQHRMRNTRPMISFTFDDFPRSALFTAGAILEKHDISGTYYTSFGLMGQVAPTGEIFHSGDVPLVLQRGHELGCHTYAHSHAYDTAPGTFEESIVRNQAALKETSRPGCGRATSGRRSRDASDAVPSSGSGQGGSPTSRAL